MSYAIVQKLREMSDEELFDTCIVNLVHMYKKGIYTFENEKNIPLHKNNKFKESVYLFQHLIHNADEGRISLSEYVRTIPIYVELSTRINRIRKHTISSEYNRLSRHNAYAYDNYKLINKRIEFKASPYIKMRLGLILSYNTISRYSYIGLADRYIRSYISEIKKLDDLILNDSREVLKTINAMKRNMDETYYDIY